MIKDTVVFQHKDLEIKAYLDSNYSWCQIKDCIFSAEGIKCWSVGANIFSLQHLEYAQVPATWFDIKRSGQVDMQTPLKHPFLFSSGSQSVRQSTRKKPRKKPKWHFLLKAAHYSKFEQSLHKQINAPTQHFSFFSCSFFPPFFSSTSSPLVISPLVRDISLCVLSLCLSPLDDGWGDGRSVATVIWWMV